MNQWVDTVEGINPLLIKFRYVLLCRLSRRKIIITALVRIYKYYGWQ